jgi:hypothetical protein
VKISISLILGVICSNKVEYDRNVRRYYERENSGSGRQNNRQPETKVSWESPAEKRTFEKRLAQAQKTSKYLKTSLVYEDLFFDSSDNIVEYFHRENLESSFIKVNSELEQDHNLLLSWRRFRTPP